MRIRNVSILQGPRTAEQWIKNVKNNIYIINISKLIGVRKVGKPMPRKTVIHIYGMCGYVVACISLLIIECSVKT